MRLICWSICFVLFLCLSVAASSSKSPAVAPIMTPTSSPREQPLVPISQDPNSYMRAARVIPDDGFGHLEGEIYLFVQPAFNIEALRDLEPDAQLVSEQPPDMQGLRQLLVHVPEDALDATIVALRNTPGVATADRNSILRRTTFPNDPAWPEQAGAGAALLNLPPAWFVSRGLASVRVAVLDGGVNEVADLVGRVDPGRSFVGQDPNDTSDHDGHGTGVASIIAATTDNGLGIAGVAPNVHIVPVNVCSGALLQDCLSVEVADGLRWVLSEIRNGRPIQVVNMSFGSPGQPDTRVQDALSDLASLGVINVAVTGNGGDGSVWKPGNDPHVVAVGGVDANGIRSVDSSYGPEIAVAAPYQTYSLNQHGQVFYFPGTSAAAPVISGLAALFKSTAPHELSNKDAFVDAMRITGNGNTRAGWNQYTGYGVPNAWSTIWAQDCEKFDLDGDRAIGLGDEQIIAFHWGDALGLPGYSPQLDLQPLLISDGDTDILDLETVFGRNSFICPE